MMKFENEELITKQDIEDWNSGKINVISNYYNGCESYESYVYYPNVDVTIYLRHFFEGYFNDDMIDQFLGIYKGRIEIEDIVKQWNEEYLEDQN